MREEPFPIVRRPADGTRIPILVSVPHYGTLPLPHITRDDYSEPWFETFAYGFADTFASDLYHDLDQHRLTIREFANERNSWTKVGEIIEGVYQRVLAK